jgi:hypothetical protein
MNERIWLLTIEALDELNFPKTLRFASGDYIDPDGNYYDLRIKQPALYTNSAFLGSVLSANSVSGYGESVLVNPDGGLDYLADYATDGRKMTLSLLLEDGSIKEVLSGSVQGLRFEGSTVSVQLRDEQTVLDTPHPYSTYLGSNVLPNGVEGLPGDIRGIQKPRVFGNVRNVEPMLVNTVNRIYQVHDVSKSTGVDVIAVYDRGVLLLLGETKGSLNQLMSSTPAAGYYNKWQGYFKLGSQPSGVITADVDSTKSLAGDVVSDILSEVGYTLDAASKTFLNTSSGRIGIYMLSETTTSEMLNTVSQGVGAYWFVSKTGFVFFTPLSEPLNPFVELFDYQILNISRKSTGAGSNGLPIHKVRLKVDKVEFEQTDLAPGADELVRAKVTNQWRESSYENSSVKTRHPLSEELILETAIRDVTNGNQQAQRIQQFLGVRRDSVSLSARLNDEIVDLLEVGKVVRVTSRKLGYSSGKNFVILGYTLNARLSKVDLELFG